MSPAGDMERQPQRYVIEAHRLLQTTQRGGQTVLDWPVHLRESHPSLAAGFREPFTVAVRRHLRQTLDKGELRLLWPHIVALIEASFARVGATS